MNQNLSFNYKARSEKQPKKQQTEELKENLILNFLNAQSNNNISFCAAQTAIYAVDEEGNYQKFDGRRDAER